MTDAEVSAYSELLYTDLDLFNTPPKLYWSRIGNVGVSLYNAVNGNRANKTEFELNMVEFLFLLKHSILQILQ